MASEPGGSRLLQLPDFLVSPARQEFCRAVISAAGHGEIGTESWLNLSTIVPLSGKTRYVSAADHMHD
jgi:hypothetical protein